jgi:GMP synthase (glutamine-hydrolysing)
MLQTLTRVDDTALAAIAEEKKIRGTDEVFILFSLGSQFDHLIKQNLDKLGVFSLVADPSSITADDVKKIHPKGIILSGGPASAYEQPPFDGKIFDLGIPVLGICLGFQMWAHHLGVAVTLSPKREFGIHALSVKKNAQLFDNLPSSFEVLESHGDIIHADKKLEVLAITDNAPVAAAQHGHLWGVQFHPEVTDTEHGYEIYENFIFKICGAKDKFPAASAAKKKIESLQKEIAGKKILLALSGGADSSTVAYLLKEAGGAKIRAVYIQGIDRPDDEAYVKKFFGAHDWLELRIVDATGAFLTALKGKIGMRDKRLAMRGVYKKVLEDEAKDFGADFIAQGTLYTDVSESGGGYASGAKKAQIKLHHNVGLDFSVPELAPLIDSVKDTGRAIGREIGVPEELLMKHPFPGPGLVVRIEGEVTEEKLRVARHVDGIFIEELRAADLYKTVWQAGATITSSITTATKGDDAAEGHVVALWAVWSVNGFTARAAELPYDFLKKVSQRITNEIREVGAVVYRISDKPPTTIEWG